MYKRLTFHKASAPPDAFKRSAWVAKGLTPAQAKHAVEQLAQDTIYLSDCGTYQVHVRQIAATDKWPAMVHLSIKRCDREPINDWRAMQAIKNALVGDEHEAVELYPAESRLIDTANQYHLWVLADASISFPFGFDEGRKVHDEGEHPALGAKQRPLTEKEQA